MSSGFGARGGTGRCYQYFEDFVTCFQTQPFGKEFKRCYDFRDDYFECLHHKGEAARNKQIKEEMHKPSNPTASQPHH